MRRRYQSSLIPTIFSTPSSSEQSIGTGTFWHHNFGENSINLRLRYLLIIPIIYLFAGLFIDNLWRGVDANSFSVLYGFKNYAEFQGEFFRQSVLTSPAYFRLLEFGVQIFDKLLAPAIAMRITNAVLILGGSIAIYRTLRLVYPADISSITAISAVTCLGGLELFHLTTPRVGGFFAIAISMYGIALSLQKIYGGVILGFGFVLSIMMGGGTLIPTLIPSLILLFQRREDYERKKNYQVAMLLAISMMGITLFNFYIFTGRSALEPNLWLPINNFENFSDWGMSAIRFIWFCLPLLPAFYGFRNFARKQWTENSLHLLLIGGAGALCAFPLSLFSQDSPLLILPFLSLLFAPALLLLNLQWHRGTYWFVFLFFTIAIVLIYVLRILWLFPSNHNTLAENISEVKFPGFDYSLSVPMLLFATAILIFWFYWNLSGKKYFSWTIRPTVSWIIGMMCFWLLIIMLWQPAVDYSKSYRPMILEINKTTGDQCIEVSNTPISFRVNWLYITNKRPIPVSDLSQCDYQLLLEGKISRESLLITDAISEKNENMGSSNTELPLLVEDEIISTTEKILWKEIAGFNRPGENSEKFILYKKEIVKLKTRKINK